MNGKSFEEIVGLWLSDKKLNVKTSTCCAYSLIVSNHILPAFAGTEVLTEEDETEPLLVTRADSDVITDCYASILAGAINACLFGK